MVREIDENGCGQIMKLIARPTLIFVKKIPVLIDDKNIKSGAAPQFYDQTLKNSN
jgi:hypothetical protein